MKLISTTMKRDELVAKTKRGEHRIRHGQVWTPKSRALETKRVHSIVVAGFAIKGGRAYVIPEAAGPGTKAMPLLVETLLGSYDPERAPCGAPKLVPPLRVDLAWLERLDDLLVKGERAAESLTAEYRAMGAEALSLWLRATNLRDEGKVEGPAELARGAALEKRAMAAMNVVRPALYEAAWDIVHADDPKALRTGTG